MEPLHPADPAMIGGYRLLSRLGAGGMGQVYLGQSAQGRHVAIKMIRADFEGLEGLARFRREVATVGAVRSRYSVAMIDAGVDAPPYWLATEYVPGPTLAQAVARFGALPPQTCLRLLTALAAALRDIHGQGVQHRDLKPQNVILSAGGPRLIDFGIARSEDQTAITRTGQAVGTPGYLAPEVVTHHQMSPAADVFALGGVMAFAATGRPPFGTGEAHAVIYRSITNEIDLAGVDPELARLVSACTAKDPVMRPTPDRLVSLSGVGEQLAGDPGYQALLGLSQPVPPDLASAIASGLVSAQQGTLAVGNGATSILATFSARPQRRRSRRRLLTLTGSPVAVVAMVAVVLVSHLRQDSEPGNAGATGPSGTSSASSTAGVLGEQSPSGTATTSSGKPGAVKKPNAAPTTMLRNRTGLNTASLGWESASQSCLPSVPYEEDPPPGLQYSAVRTSAGTSAKLSLRFKYDAPAGYYVAAEVREPGAYRGNEERPKFTKPVLMHGTEWSDQTYPGDFSDSFPISKDLAGDWTVIWYHVHSDGQAYFIACYGFKV